MNISALIIARDEEDKIESTLLSLSFVDEIVVVLDRSTDKHPKYVRNLQKRYIEAVGYVRGKEEILVFKNVVQNGF